MNKFTESKIFRKSMAGFEIAKIFGMLFWLPILALMVLYFFKVF